MKTFTGDQKRTWWTVGLTSVAMFGAILLLLTYRGADEGEGGAKRSLEGKKIGLTRLAEQAEGGVVAEEAQFFDPTPLFLPTIWNADQKPLPTTVLNDPGRMFPEFPSKLKFAEEGVKLAFADSVTIPDQPLDTIGMLGGEMPLQGIGRGTPQVETLSPRGGYLLIRSADNPKGAIMARNLPDATPPEDNWKPMEFMAVVNRAGLVGSLSLIERSGQESVDRYFQNYLSKTFRLGEYLSPGFYRISVGP